MTTTTSAVPNPETVTRTVLDNGLVVLVRENHTAPVVVVEGSLPVGSIHAPTNRTGLASFTASMLTRGSAHYDFDTFNTKIENVGASLSFNTGEHTLDFGTNSLSEDFPMLLEVLADALRRPTFPEAHIRRVRSQRLVQIQEREQDTQQMANLRFYESIYGDHPYGKSTTGYTDTISAIQRDDLLAFHQNYFTPDRGIIVIVGDVETGSAIDLVQTHLADWTGGQNDQATPDVTPQTSPQRLLHPIPGKVQADIVVGCQSVPRSHPDYYPIRVANTILGQFGMMGRLGETVREEQGLAYYVYSALDASIAAGVWFAAAGVNPAHIPQAVDSILTEFERLGNEAVSPAELADTQAYMTGVLPLTLETNAGVATTLHNMQWYGLGLDYLERYKEIIYSITTEDVQRVASTYLRPDAYTLSVAVPPGITLDI